jgi:serine O-acetyltransferase
MKEVKLTLSSLQLAAYVENQFLNFFPDNSILTDRFKLLIERALERSLFCFSNIIHKHFSNSNQVFFNHLNGDQYATFLYFLSNEGYKNQIDDVYFKSAYLNKTLHGIDLFGHIEMPNIFLLVHPVGTIIGRAVFDEKIVIYQGVTIGGKHRADGSIDYPRFSENTVIYSNATIIGNTFLPKNSVVASGAFISDFKLEETKKIIVGQYPKNVVKDLIVDQSFFV